MNDKLQEKDIVKLHCPSALREIATLMARLHTENTKHQDRADLPDRSLEKRMQNRINGNIACYTIAEYLTKNGIPVRIFDFERETFSNPDFWDICIPLKNQKIITVEIKSSGPDKNIKSLADILEKRHLAVKPGEQKDFNIQTYFLSDLQEINNIYVVAYEEKNELDRLQREKQYHAYNEDKSRFRFNPFLNEYKPIESLITRLKKMYDWQREETNNIGF
jgi:hypothetical protein